MELYILDAQYHVIGCIDEAESVLWDKKYNETGYCEIYTPCEAEMLELLRKGNYVFRYDDDMFCKIETVEITTDAEEGDYIIATANDMSNILAGRVVRWQIVHTGTVGDFIKRVLDENIVNPAQEQRRISNFSIDESNFPEFDDKIDVTTSGEDVYQLISSTCKAYNYGFRVSYDIEVGQIVFRLYRGKDKATGAGEEYVEFSPAFGNILSSSYKEDDSNYKNIAYVGYKDANDELKLLSMFNGDEETSGETRREIYVDGTQESREITLDVLNGLYPAVYREGDTYYADITGEKIAVATVSTGEGPTETDGTGSEEKIVATDYTYMQIIRRLGRFALADHTRTRSISGSVDTVDTYEYKVDYDLGDVVSVTNEYGISTVAVVVEVLESDDADDGYVIEPKFEYDS